MKNVLFILFVILVGFIFFVGCPQIDSTTYFNVVNSSNGDGNIEVQPSREQYTLNENLQFTAVPDTGWEFDRWEGDLTGSTNPKSITITKNLNIQAYFVQQTFSVDLLKEGNGNLSINPNKTAYLYGENITLIAAADTGWSFVGWYQNNILMSTSNTYSFNITEDTEIKAKFIQRIYTLQINGVNGTVEKTLDKASYVWGEVVQLNAIPNNGWQFDHWEDDLSGSVNPSSITMDSNKIVTAIFSEIPVETHTLDMTIIGNGNVTKNPNKAEYEEGENVEITAVPDTGWQFDSWEGDLIGSVNPSFVTMDSNKIVTAIFSEIPPETYTLNITINGNGGVTKNPNKAEYEDSEKVELTAVPDTGWEFDRWEGDLTGNVNPSFITMDSDKEVTAIFSEIPVETYTLDITIQGNGDVTKNPNKAEYEDGENVELTAVPETGWEFDRWEVDLTGSVNPSFVTMDSDKEITAVFTEIPAETYTLDIIIQGNGSVTKNPDKAEYEDGDNVRIEAVPDTGWGFDRWEGDLTGSENPTIIKMNSNKEITAIFSLLSNDPPSLIKISGPSGTVNTDSQTFQWSGSDADGTIVNYEYKKDNGSWVYISSTQYVWTSISEGSHTFEVRARDDDGAYSNIITWSFSYTISNIPPTISKVSGPSGTVNVDSQTFQWSGSDTDGTIVNYEYRKDGGSWVNESGTQYTWNSINEGSHTFDVRAKDDDGDYSSIISWSFSYTTSNIPPTVSKISGPSGTVNVDSQSFQWTGSDTDGTIVNYEYRKDGGNWVNESNTQYTWNSISEGSHTFEVRAKDDDGDYSSIITWSFEYSTVVSNVDLTGPTYNGNILLVSNESINTSNNENVGNLSIINTENLKMENSDDIYMIDVNIPFYPSENDKIVTPDMIVDSYNLYDTKSFWTYNFDLDKDVQINATLQYIGTNVEIWVEDTNEITASKAQQLGQEFDSNIWGLVVNNFYTPSDVNSDGRVAVLCFDIQDGFSGSGGYIGGYFYSGDLYITSTSNKMEVFYIDTYPSMHNPKTNPVNVSSAYSTLAHEFQHMVNYNRNRFVEGGSSMVTWLNEAFSMAAEHMYEDVQTSRISYYNSSENIRNGHSLLKWNDNGDVLANYSLSYLFGQYIRVQMGQGDSIFKEILEDYDNNYQCVENAIHDYIDSNMDFGDFMTNFRIALLLKESTGYYGFKGEPFFDSINTRTSVVSHSTIVGGEAFFIDIGDGSYTESGTQGPNIQYAGITD